MPTPRLPLATALATVAAVTAPTPPSAPAAAGPAPVEHCVTTALSAEEAAAGVVNEVACWVEDEYTPLSMRASVLLAVHWDGPGGTGSALDVYRASCTGASLNLSGTAWDNRISSTTHITCGNVKHHTGVFSGANQLTTGGYGAVRNMDATLNNAVTSADYAP